MHTIVLASGNRGKLAEFEQMLDRLPGNCSVRPQSDFDVGDVAETGLSFVENAIIKARHAAKISGLPAVADDSGIEVDALRGAPGIYSARYSGEGANDQRNNAKLLEALSDIPADKRSARYQCILVLMRHAEDPVPLICQASWEGHILSEARGEGGFGYDPLFFVPELGVSAAELPKAEKNAISHRGKALQQLAEQWPAWLR